MPTANDIRRQFIDYFVQKAGHTAVPSSPVVPHDDPTLLFTNAGMNQFKDVFLGTCSRPYTRAVDTQKCIRAGGKHNDLDDVGKDTYHHTFFEMLGNWSFGDYFKKEAIDWAWDLLTNVWKLDPARLHATYFQGDADEGLEPDHEARDLWLRHLPADHVHPGDKKDNFWEMGDTGPCGPCSELHYDGRTLSPSTPADGIRRSSPATLGQIPPGPVPVNADHPDVIEIWNLVFIQFNRLQSGGLEPLPANHVDTGMGFERIVRVLQGKSSNYDTDVFSPLFAAIRNVTGAREYSGKLDDPVDIAYRVIADHIRTLTFALTDGAHCGNEGRNYVLRRILRRAVFYGQFRLGVKLDGPPGPFFYKLVPAVIENFKDAFPELTKHVDKVTAEIRDEEESFGKTLDRGITLFDEAARGLAPGGKIPADDAFQLHDTYGFPLDLTQLMAAERGMTVDVEGFNRLMNEAREKSRGGGASGGAGGAKQSLLEHVQKGLDAGWFTGTDFTGYTSTEAPFQPNTLTLFKKTGEVYEAARQARAGDEVAVVLGMSTFYAESGGQVGDSGSILVRESRSQGPGVTASAAPLPGAGGQVVRLRVTDTLKLGEVHVHLATVSAGTLDSVEGPVSVAMAVDADRRAAIMANHTATHLMNRALRDHVNPEANQRGSLVDDQKLRFDFSHDSALTAQQIAAVEKQVNDDIAGDLTVHTDFVPQERALKIHGLRAVFGEKYPPIVRVVSIGAAVEDLLSDPDNADWPKHSIEFCGGTHLTRTGEAERFCIVSQDAVSKGVRRVTALTGSAAHQAAAEGDMLLRRVEVLHDAPGDVLMDEIDAINKAVDAATLPQAARHAIRVGLSELTQKLKAYEKDRGDAAAVSVVEAARQVADAGDGRLIVAQVPGADAKTLRAAMDVIRAKHPEAAMLLAAHDDEKVALLASVPQSLIDKGLKAGDWIKAVAPVVGGGGGGRPDLAQAGGKDPSKVHQALEAAKAFAHSRM